MKNNPTIVVCITVLLISIFNSSSFAQDEKPDLRLIERIQSTECETLLSRLDMLAIELRKDKKAKGYAVMYPSGNLIKDVIFSRTLQGYPRGRGLNAERFEVIIAPKPKGEIIYELWFGRNGTAPEISNNPISLVLPADQVPLLAFDDTVELYRFEGELHYRTHGCEVCCLFAFRARFLSELLSKNPQLTANIGVYGDYRKNAISLRRLVKQDLEDAKVPADRVNFSIWNSVPGKPHADDWEEIRGDKIFRLRVWLD